MSDFCLQTWVPTHSRPDAKTGLQTLGTLGTLDQGLVLPDKHACHTPEQFHGEDA